MLICSLKPCIIASFPHVLVYLLNAIICEFLRNPETPPSLVWRVILYHFCVQRNRFIHAFSFRPIVINSSHFRIFFLLLRFHSFVELVPVFAFFWIFRKSLFRKVFPFFLKKVEDFFIFDVVFVQSPENWSCLYRVDYLGNQVEREICKFDVPSAVNDIHYFSKTKRLQSVFRLHKFS